MLAVFVLLTAAPLSGFVGMQLPEIDFIDIFAPDANAATSGTYGNNLTWILNSGTLTVSGIGAMFDYGIINAVPWYSSRSSIKTVIIENGVTSIGAHAFYYCTSLTSVTIPDSVTSIGGSAFYGCTSLTSVTIPDSVTSIEVSAFYGCTSLTSITIPDSVTSIGVSAFYGCTSLTSVIISDTAMIIGKKAFYNTAYYNNESNWTDGVLYIGNHLIIADTNIAETYAIKYGTITIAARAFYNCTSLTSVTIPDSVTSIGEDAFYNCTSLTSVTIPDSVTNIGGSAFRACKALNSITIPDSVISIGSEAFTNTAYRNNDSNWVDGVLYIDNHLISDNRISGACTIKYGTKTIADFAFCNSSLSSIIIPDSVTNIGAWAFKGCNSLTSITIPDSVTSIRESTFKYCNSLISVSIGDSVTSIGVDAFYDCGSLTTISIGDSVTSIGDSAFKNCTSLTSVYITDIVAWCNLDFTNEYSNPLYYANHLYLNGTLVTKLTIPDKVTAIKNYAFYSCTPLTSIIIPNSVTSIGDYAFRNCTSLTSITIPDSVTSIGVRAFYNCTSLKDVYYAGSKEDWKKITIGSNNYCLTNANIHYNSKPKVYFDNQTFCFYAGATETTTGDTIVVIVSDSDADNLQNFDPSTVELSTDDTMLKLNGIRDSVISEDGKSIAMTLDIQALKPGETTLTATLDDVGEESCTIKILPPNEMTIELQTLDQLYSADRFFFDEEGNFVKDTLELYFSFSNNILLSLWEDLLITDPEIIENLKYKNIRFEFLLDDSGLAFAENNATTLVKEYESLDFKGKQEEKLKIICKNPSKLEEKEGLKVKLSYKVYFDDPITGENIEKGTDFCELNIISYKRFYVKEHLEAMQNGSEYHTILMDSFARKMKGLEDTRDFIWTEVMSKGIIDNFVSLVSDFDEITGYEIVIADLLSKFSGIAVKQQEELISEKFMEFINVFYDTMLNCLTYDYVADLFEAAGGADGGFTINAVADVLAGNVNSGPCYNTIQKILDNDDFVAQLKILKGMEITIKVLGGIGATLETIKGIQTATAVTAACETYKAILDSNKTLFEKMQTIAKEYGNDDLAEALGNYINYDEDDVLETLGNEIATSLVSGAGSGIQFISSVLIDLFAKGMAEKVFSVIGVAVAGFEGGKMLSNLLCNTGDYAAAAASVVSAGYISETLFYTIVQLYEELIVANEGNVDYAYSKAQELDAALELYKCLEEISYEKTIKAMKAEASSVVGKFFAERYEVGIKDIIIKKPSFGLIHCHDEAFEKIYLRVIAPHFTENETSFPACYKTICVQCPVDVLVTNSKGEIVAQIEDDQIVSKSNGIEIIVYGSEKYILVPGTEEYDISITATDAGTMNYQILEYDEKCSNIRTVEYNAIPLYDGQVFAGSVDTQTLASSDTYNLTTGDTTIYADKDEYTLEEGHTYTCTVTKATCTTEGKRVYVCTCGDTYTETIPVASHTDADGDGICDICKQDVTPAYTLGDVDENGKIEATDARLALRAAVKLETLTETQTKAADADKNGKIEAADARRILRAAVGLDSLS